MTYPHRDDPPVPHPTTAGDEHRTQVPSSAEPTTPSLTPNEVLDLLGVEALPLTYARFLAAVLGTLVNPDAAEWRVGQTLTNVLAAQRPDLAERVLLRGLDTFHHDARVPHALRWLEANWDAREDREDQPTDRAEENHDG